MAQVSEGGRMTELEKVVEQINKIITTTDFPIVVIQDVNKRLMDCREVNYASQQLRYLQNVKKAMEAKGL
jgi:CO dehydrogenase/acetyl-CoA synthase epsilon subunit